MRIQWEKTAYTVSENNRTVELRLIKVGSTVTNVSVQVMTVAVNATGEHVRPLFRYVAMYHITSVQ